MSINKGEISRNRLQYLIAALVIISLGISLYVFFVSSDWIATGTVMLACFGAIGIIYSSVTVAMMKEEKRPYVFMDYISDPNSPSVIDILIQNGGRSSAVDVKVTITPPEQETLMKEKGAIFKLMSEMSIVKNVICYLPPDGERHVMYGMGHMIAEYLPLKHTVHISYKDIYGKKYEESLILEPSNLMNTSSADRADVAELKKIVTELSDIKKQQNELVDSLKVISGERKVCPCCKEIIIGNNREKCSMCEERGREE
ncbi:MAG: hypothetical protein PHI87_04105 [Candidatus Methanomethylophilus sp.]|nr:hypothetical protein [Methanomethylophilus sp.]